MVVRLEVGGEVEVAMEFKAVEAKRAVEEVELGEEERFEVEAGEAVGEAISRRV